MALTGDGRRRPGFAGTRVSDVDGEHANPTPAPSVRARGGTANKDDAGYRRDPTTDRRARGTSAQGGGALRAVGIVLGLSTIVGLLLLLSYIILSNTSAFTIASIDAESTEHVSAEAIARLANIAEGTTLLNVNEEQVREGLRKNPWIASADIDREFPDKLRITVTEREVGALVVMGSDGVVWCLGRDDVWIEPLELSPAEGQTASDAALLAANDMGAILVTDVPASVSPLASYAATDEELRAVTTFRNQLSPLFLEQIASVSAPSAESIACLLKNGVSVSLGAATNISVKESLVTRLLERYPNRLTYINVRVPSNPSYRMVDSESVREGTGSVGQYYEQEDESSMAGPGEAGQADEVAGGFDETDAYLDDEGDSVGEEEGAASYE